MSEGWYNRLRVLMTERRYNRLRVSVDKGQVLQVEGFSGHRGCTTG